MPVTIQDKIFGEVRLRHMARVLGTSVQEAVGILAFIWRGANQEGKTEATEAELRLWSETTHEKLLESLIVGRFIDDKDCDLFEPGTRTFRIKGLKKASEKKPQIGPKVIEIWMAYSKEYSLRYSGIEPKKTSVAMGMCKQILAKVGDEAVDVVRFYVRHPGSWYVQKAHQLNLCLLDADKLRTELLTRKLIRKSDADRTERSSGNALAAASFLRDGQG